MNSSTIVFGYSENPERYSYKAFQLLKEHEHNVVAFNPRVDGIQNLPQTFDTLTMYVNSEISSKFMNDLLKLNFRRVIFNPGSENPEFEKALNDKKIEVIHGCTLVMLKTDQY